MYEKLFSEGRIGRVEIKNRVVMTPMGTVIAAPGGGVNDDIIAYYEARAKGGVGLIESELCRVLDGAGAAEPCQLAARDFADLAGLARLVDTVHKYGTKMFIQLHHPGGQGSSAIGGEPIVAASAVKTSLETPRALEVGEITEIESAFVNGAMLTKMAGADGVLLHGAHGYLINSFLSPYLNKRIDDYGGNPENRMRFLLEIIKGIREQCGEDFPLGVRLSVEEFLGKEGNGLEESCRICERLEEAGVDFIDVSCGGIPGSSDVCATIEPGTYEQCWKSYMAAEVKKHVNIPVIAVCNIKEPDVAEQILEDGCCDFVGVARGHLADPEWCNKARAGKAETIRKCIGCLCCFQEIVNFRHVKCAVNPKLGREREFQNPKYNGEGRTVVVIGGGPAGIEAALLLDRRGFDVVLFDRPERLGGTLNVADKGVGKEKITRLVDGMIAQVEASDIELRMGEEATVEKVKALSPCGVFIACGAMPMKPPIPGIDGKNVVTAEDVLMGRAEPKGNCIILGSGMTGLETAEVVLKAGHRTTIVDMLPEIGQGISFVVIFDIKRRLAKYGPTYMLGHEVLEITKDGVALGRMDDGEKVFVNAETIILALGVRPRKDVVEAFKAAFREAHILGDANRGGRVLEATQDAYGQAFVFES
ncbi:MAG: FAD-dependent oxidoreductase [Methanothrix sp.]|jgi:2,4-dienoyl-CoA reductase-like NADH-dependent reductase (Old Yellow Enzyme family)/thioredoxin reductase|uniref:NADH oxidase n=1 Tax=Methanothrix harundinacea TaxID=301375 RepID=A0A101FU48_9EURY|nr:MAG: NADH oxidase [Methanothrix harundinacea]MDD2639087.1 FAD-dependent oxidoreductase [Methanothrix sp.]KUK94466.1 MAG: NADH oxidase [Methanothrix harundinacea]MCP1392664.1 FAD-dependent oxidoreductase [Methanothrix harundinacea]MDD3709898.1 FAD-dependent oxidoreductase [Methanothrix sp.]